MSIIAVERVEQISLDQIRGNYDDDAVRLVEEYHLAGWSSHMSNRGHVIVRAPDGSDSASVTRDSLRGRSGRNAAAPLKRWLRREKKQVEAALREVLTRRQPPVQEPNAFGIPDVKAAKMDAMGAQEIPPRIEVQMRENADLKAHLRKLTARGKDVDERLLIASQVETGSFRRWVVVDRAAQIVVAHGDEITDDEAFDLAVQTGRITRKPRKVRDNAVTPAVAPGEELNDVTKAIVCPDCGEQVPSIKYTTHRKWKHDGFPCPECGQMFNHPRTMGVHRSGEHGIKTHRNKLRAEAEEWGVAYISAHETDVVNCRWCGIKFENAAGRATHERRAHKEKGEMGPLKKTPPVVAKKTKTKSKPKSTVVSRAVPTPEPAVMTVAVPNTGTSDVPVTSPGRVDLSEVLGSLPEGGDAVDMIAKIRSVVTPSLVHELLAERKENDRLRHENEILTKQNEDLATRMAMMREALTA